VRFAALGFAPLVLVAAAGCHGAVAEDPAACASDACDAGSAANAPDAPDTCSAPVAPDGGFVPYQAFANGNVSGASTSAILCNAGVALSDYGGQPGSGSVVLEIDTNTTFGSLNVGAPSGAVSGRLTGSIALGASAAGVYTSADPQACGALTFSYGTLSTPRESCRHDAGSYACPTGCTLTYFCGQDAAAEPCCVPLAKTFEYQATGCARNPQATQPTLGAWTLTLTAMAPYEGDAGADYGVRRYLAHGTLTATLTGTVDTTDSASLSLRF